MKTKHHTSCLSVCVRVVEEAVTRCSEVLYVLVTFLLAFQRTKHEIYRLDVDFELKNCTIKNKSLGSNGFF